MENRNPNRLLVGRMGDESSDSVASSLPSLRASSEASAASSSSFSTGVLAMTKLGPQPQRPDDELSGIDWVDSVVDVASTCKKILTAHTCRLCQVYTDAQVEFEVRQEESANQQQQQQHQNPARSAAPVTGSSFFQTMMPNPLEVEMYRQFLFDEDSVVEGVTEREKVFEDDDEDDEQAEQLAAAVAAATNATWR